MAIGLLAHVAPAAAQTISTPLIRERADARPSSQLPQWISYADCVSNVALEFDVTLSAADGNSTLEVWAGTADCSAAEKRQTNSTGCWLVYSETPSRTDWLVAIRAQDIVAQRTPGSVTANTCDAGGSRAELTLTFMFKNGDVAVSPVLFAGTGVDVTAPGAPSGIDVKAGENRLHLDWNDSPAGDLLGYNFYCDPPPGKLAPDAGFGTVTAAQTIDAGADSSAAGGGGATTDAGSLPTGAGGAGAGGGLVSNCTGRGVLSEGSRPDPALKCGSVTGKSAASGVARGLVNGTEYGVSIAAVDTVGNIGVLSAVSCGTPVPITDFYEYYRQLDGGGGGGFCTTSRGRATSPGSAGALSLLLGLLVARRRGRRA